MGTEFLHQSFDNAKAPGATILYAASLRDLGSRLQCAGVGAWASMQIKEELTHDRCMGINRTSAVCCVCRSIVYRINNIRREKMQVPAHPCHGSCNKPAINQPLRTCASSISWCHDTIFTDGASTAESVEDSVSNVTLIAWANRQGENEADRPLCS
ncbi:hypothetical protein GQ55_9G437400 [Panicum hallii var. hallii]|uniref:Uncharacterized protein n=1 Tax=Panicum hallii var. hallii TaxID=1504633 RepID=A0A2T7CB85_9POAL|nr:hypothetical protein GQ55_9G437400 [Panicum hallii var. hallii]